MLGCFNHFRYDGQMKQGTLNYAQSGRRASYIAVLGILTASCGNSANSTAIKSIVVDREVLFRDIKMSVNAIARAPDGHFVVAGDSTFAHAFVTDSQGTVVWEYKDSAGLIADGYASTFYGAVTLADGDVLFCGNKRTADRHTVNEISILARDGTLVERRVEMPNGDPTFTSSGFVKCFPWNGAIVAAGYASKGTLGFTWILTLTATGKKVSEAFFQGTSGTEIAANSAANLVFTVWKSENTFEVLRASPTGQIVARRGLAGGANIQLRSLEVTKNTRIISYAVGGKATLYTLDDNLMDAARPQAIGDFDVTKGCGYVLADNSIVLFGRTTGAAIEWIGVSGARSISLLDPKYFAYTINDAVPVSQNQFVAIRNSASTHVNDNGLVMAWITVK